MLQPGGTGAARRADQDRRPGRGDDRERGAGLGDRGVDERALRVARRVADLVDPDDRPGGGPGRQHEGDGERGQDGPAPDRPVCGRLGHGRMVAGRDDGTTPWPRSVDSSA